MRGLRGLRNINNLSNVNNPVEIARKERKLLRDVTNPMEKVDDAEFKVRYIDTQRKQFYTLSNSWKQSSPMLSMIWTFRNWCNL